MRRKCDLRALRKCSDLDMSRALLRSTNVEAYLYIRFAPLALELDIVPVAVTVRSRAPTSNDISLHFSYVRESHFRHAVTQDFHATASGPVSVSPSIAAVREIYSKVCQTRLPRYGTPHFNVLVSPHPLRLHSTIMRFLEVPGLIAKIYVNGTSLEEYDDDDEERATHSTATKYVEATSGANFAIKICFYDNFPYIGDNVLCRVRVDGTAVIAQLYQPKNCQAYLIKGRYRNTSNVSTLRRFAFADLHTRKFHKFRI